MWSEGQSKARLCDKEMAAVTYNLKEQRVLEKSLQTLKLEQGYALKLLQLDNRIIKVQYKKLKEKVSKIKSHLPAEDISKFRDLDAQGKLPSNQSCVNLGSAVKIAAAARRLHLGGRPRTRSALPRIQVHAEPSAQQQQQAALKKRQQIVGQAGESKLKRSSSITGAFIDAPQPRQSDRPGSAMGVIESRTLEGEAIDGGMSGVQSGLNLNHSPSGRNELDFSMVNGVERDGRPGATVASMSSKDAAMDYLEPGVGYSGRPKTGVRPMTSGAKKEISVEYLETGTSSRPPAKPRASTAHPRSHSTFSSHVAAGKGEVNSAVTTARSDRSRRLSCVSNDSIDSNLGENLFEERRQELLEEEGMRARLLDQRTKDFLKDVEEYLEENPPLQTSHVAAIPQKDSLVRPMSAGGPESMRPMRLQRRSDRPTRAGAEWDATPTFFPEDQYKSRLVSLWKDMNKCRYLRMPDEKIDLSGVNTLVKDQMKMFETLRTADRAPISGAWEN